MASKEHRSTVVVSGKVNKQGFADIKKQLTGTMDLAKQISDKLIDFGKDSVDVYGQYEQNMADARAAMAAGSKMSAREMAETFDALNEAAQQWASTSKFTTGDVSNAISEAAHAGWDLEKIMQGIPQAMLLAQAGGMDLSEALGMIVNVTNGAQVSFDDIGTLIDQWTTSSSRSATNIEQMGEALKRMGATMQFADSTAEVMTMTGILANMGVTGEAAGTMLRNTMLRIAAPTNTARDLIERLGAEIEDEGASAEETAAALQEMGVSIYDKNGGLRPMQEIFSDMNDALAGMDEKAQNGALSKIFGTRNITAAMALIRAAGAAEGGWAEFQEAVEASGGSAQLYSDIMMDTQQGKLALMNAAVEELKRSVGESLSPTITAVAETITGMINGLTNMDPTGFNAIVTGLATFAGISTGLTTAAAAVKAIASLGTFGGLGLAALALTGIVAGIDSYTTAMEEKRFSENFGEMMLDVQPVLEYLKGVGGDFSTAAAAIEGFNAAVAGSEDAFKGASSNLSRGMYSILMTGGTADESSLKQMQEYGKSMYSALITGIENAQASERTFWQFLFGGEGTAENNANYQTLIGALDTEYEAAIEQAASLDQRLRDQITSAWADGKLSEDERQAIMETMADYNAAMADAAAADAAGEREVLLRKAQGASWDSANSIAGEITAARDARLAALDDQFWRNYGRRKYYGASDEELAAMQAAYQTARGNEAKNYNDTLQAMWQSVINDSDLADVFVKALTEGQETYGKILRGQGNIAEQQLMFGTEFASGQQIKDLQTMMANIVQSYGGIQNVPKEWQAAAALLTSTDIPVADKLQEAQAYADGHPVTIHYTNDAGGGTLPTYAEGGRADEASIFGEAGAEWAIPEEHSANTARLLNQARIASGFTWADLMASSGRSSGGSQTFVYSPTIHAENAEGVAQTLEADKKRMQKWWREMQMNERTVSYA